MVDTAGLSNTGVDLIKKMETTMLQQNALQTAMQQIASDKSMAKMAHDMEMASVRTNDAVSRGLNAIMAAEAQQIAQA